MSANSYAQKSTQITNLDASPTVRPTAGEDGAAAQTVIAQPIPFTTGDTTVTTTIYNVLRVPTTAVLKTLHLIADAPIDVATTPTLTWAVGLAYSDNTNYDGTKVANQGTYVNSGTEFASADTAGTQASGGVVHDISPTLGNQVLPLWKGPAGLTSDPGGFFDITMQVSAISATETSTVPVNIGLRASFVSP